MASNETKKAQIALRKYQEVAKLHLEILKKHKDNIREYRSAGDHKALSIEKSRADLVVKQLHDDVQKMFTWCSDLHTDTWEWVQSQVRPLNTRIQSALYDFLNECGNDMSVLQEHTSNISGPDGYGKTFNNAAAAAATRNLIWIEDNENSSVTAPIDERQQQQALLSDHLELRRAEAETHKRLLSDILELNEIMKEMDAVVRVQGDMVETIADNIDRAVVNVDGGERNLFKAMKTKVASYPIAGAIIGASAAAGPVGLLIGLKVAVVAAIGGSAVGAISGHFIRKKVIADGSTSLEMKPLSTTSKLDRKSNKSD